MRSILGFAVAVAVTLAAIYLYNKFSGSNVSKLGAAA